MDSVSLINFFTVLSIVLVDGLEIVKDENSCVVSAQKKKRGKGNRFHTFRMTLSYTSVLIRKLETTTTKWTASL